MSALFLVLDYNDELQNNVRLPWVEEERDSVIFKIVYLSIIYQVVINATKESKQVKRKENDNE